MAKPSTGQTIRSRADFPLAGSISRALALSAALLFFANALFAADKIWTGGADTQWSNNPNWTGNHPAAGDNAVFNQAITFQPNLTGATSINGLWMTGSSVSSVTISGSTLTLGAGNAINGVSGLGILVDNSNASALTISAGVKIGGAQSWLNSSGNLFTVSGAVDLNTKAFAIDGSGNTTISGVVSSSGAFTKTGSGALTLSNTANSFTGQLTVQAGTLKIDNVNDASTNGELGNNALSVILGSSGSTGTLEFSGATDSGTKRFTLATGGAGAFQIDSAGTTLTLNGVIDGSGAIVKSGAGTLSLAGLNTYTGGTTVNGGTLAINSASSLGASSGAVTINAGTVELLAGNSVSASRLFYLGNAASTLQVDSGSSWTIGTVISNAATPGSLIKTGTGTLILSSAGNTYGGSGYTTSINGGTLQVGADNLLGNSANTVTFNGGALLFSTGFTSSRGIVMAGAGTINTNNNAATLSGVVSGSGVLTKTGAGTLTLSGTNTYSGGTTITGGNSSAVSISSASNVGSGSVSINGGAVLVSTANLTLTNGIVLGAVGGGAQGDGNSVSGILNVATGTTLTLSINGISEVTSGTGRLEKIGAGTLVITSAGTYSGGTYVHDGTIIAANLTALGPQTSGNTLTLDNGAQLMLAVSGVFTTPIFIGTGGDTVGATTSTNVAFDNGVVANVAGQTGGFTVGSGINGMGGANTFLGNVTVNGGAALSISRDVNLGAASNQLVLNNNSTLKIEDGVNVVSNTSVQATFATSRQFSLTGGTATIEVDNTSNAINTLPGALGTHTNVLTANGLITGSGGLVKSGAGTLVLTNAGNNYSGGTVINSGILSTADPSALGAATGALTINPTGIYQVTSSFISSRLVTLGGTGGAASGGTFDVGSGLNETRTGVISGTGSLTKTGSGKLTLDTNNTYTGDTFINGGTVSTSSNQSLGAQPTLGSSAGAVHLANGTTLQDLVSSTGTNRQMELVSGTATLDIGSGFTQQRNGLIYGAGGMIKSDGGTLILTNANTYSGGTVINGGHLQVNNTSGSGTGTGAVTINSGGALSGEPTATGFSTPGTISGTVTVNAGGFIDVRSGGTFTFGGLTLNTSAITNFQLGAGTTTAAINITGTNGLALSGLSTINIANFGGGLAAGTYHLIDYTGTALANLNNLQLGSTSAGAFTYSLSNNTTNTSIDLIVSTTGSSQWANDAAGNWSTSANWTNGTAPNAALAAANFLGVINNPRTVTVDGAFTVGTLTFNNANSYTIATDNVAGHGITLQDDGVAEIDVLSGSHTISAPIALTDDVQITAGGGTSLTISGPISENVTGRGVLSSGAGTITFSGTTANTYTGLTDIDAGTLNLNKTAGVDAIGTGGLQVDIGATANLLASNQIADTASVLANGTFALGTFSETIGALNGNGSVTLGAGSVLTIGSSNNLDSDFDGVISGAGTITKTGSGTAEFDGANTFGGAGQTVTLLGGTLAVFADNNFGNAANSITFNGGTELFGAALSSARAISLAGAGTVNTNNNAITLSGAITGTGTLTKTGAGTLTLSGTNTYSGGTTITGGSNSVVSIAGGSNIGSGTITISDGAMLSSTADLTLTNGIILGAPGGSNQSDGTLVSGVLNVASGTTLTLVGTGISEATSGTGRLEILGGGTVFMMTANSYGGGTYLHGATLVLADPFALGSQTPDNTLTADNGSFIVFAASGAANLGVYIGTGGAGVGALSPSNVGFSNGVVANISGQSGGFNIESGTAGLGGANTFTGSITVNSGAALSISRDANLGNASNQLVLNNNSTLLIEDGVDSVANAPVQATFSTSRQINLVGGQITFEIDNTNNSINPLPSALGTHSNTLTVNGLITGSGGLVKTGAGTLVLTNTSDNYTGGTTINAGTLSAADDASLGAAIYGLTINPTGIFQVTGTFTTARETILGGTGGASSGGTFDVTSTNNLTRDGVMSGSGSLTKTGTGTLTLLASNTYTGGTYIDAGTVAINSGTSLGNVSGAATIGNATLEVVRDITSSRNFTINNANSTLQIDSGAAYSLSGVLGGTGTLNKTGDGVLALTGTNTYSGGTSIDAGTVVVNSAGSLGNGGALTINTGTLEVATGYTTSRNVTLNSTTSAIQVDSAQNYTVTGVVSGGGSLNKSGAGTLTLTGANTFTGNTFVNNGTLSAAGASGSALATTTAISVNNGGTLLLGASDQINNSATITMNGGTIAKGNFSEGSASAVGMGALTLLGPGAVIDFGIGTVGTLSFADLIPNVDTLTIANWTGTANTVGSSGTDRLIFNSDQSANLGSFSFNGYAGAIEFDLGNGFYEVDPINPVPEPATWFAAALALLTIVYHQRKRLFRRSKMQ